MVGGLKASGSINLHGSVLALHICNIKELYRVADAAMVLQWQKCIGDIALSVVARVPGAILPCTGAKPCQALFFSSDTACLAMAAVQLCRELSKFLLPGGGGVRVRCGVCTGGLVAAENSCLSMQAITIEGKTLHTARNLAKIAKTVGVRLPATACLLACLACTLRLAAALL